MKEQRGFVFNTPEGDMDLQIDEVMHLAHEGDPDGLYALGMAYLFGWDVEADEKLGYDYLKQAVDKGQTEAMTLLVRMFMQGEYDGIDAVKAAEMSIKAAYDGIPDAQLYAGLAYMDGISVQQDYTEAARLFRLAANQGNDEARTNLAYMFQEGLGIDADLPKAFKLYRTAAKNGNVNAMFHLGICYEFGIGTKEDLSMAADSYMQGTEKGDGYAAERLAYLVSEGYGGHDPDDSKAFELFLTAANQGIPSSMYMVGFCYAGGSGVKKDEAEARKWLKMASDSDIPEAKELLSQLESE